MGVSIRSVWGVLLGASSPSPTQRRSTSLAVAFVYFHSRVRQLLGYTCSYSSSQLAKRRQEREARRPDPTESKSMQGASFFCILQSLSDRLCSCDKTHKGVRFCLLGFLLLFMPHSLSLPFHLSECRHDIFFFKGESSKSSSQLGLCFFDRRLQIVCVRISLCVCQFPRRTPSPLSILSRSSPTRPRARAIIGWMGYQKFESGVCL